MVVEVEAEEEVPSVAEVVVAPSFAIAFPLELQIGDHEVRVRDTATTSAALHGSRL